MNDQEHNLIQAARNGDQAAFGELVQQYQKRVFALAVRMCPTPELAEEAAQEAFLAAWQGLPFFRASVHGMDEGVYGTKRQQIIPPPPLAVRG